MLYIEKLHNIIFKKKTNMFIQIFFTGSKQMVNVSCQLQGRRVRWLLLNKIQMCTPPKKAVNLSWQAW